MSNMPILKVYLHENVKYIHSFELYGHLGLAMPRYARWVRIRIEKSAQKDVDYFSTRIYPIKTSRISCGKPRYKEYLLSVNFASTLCFTANTEDAKVVRLWLSSL